MKRFKTSHLWKRFLCGALSVLMIFGSGRSLTTIYADTIEHTHIWATKYVYVLLHPLLPNQQAPS